MNHSHIVFNPASLLAHYPDGVLYEKRREDGTIEFRGMRYGVEPDQYNAPFMD